MTQPIIKELTREEQASLLKVERMIDRSPKLNFDDLIGMKVPLWAIKYICEKRGLKLWELGHTREIRESLITSTGTQMLEFEKPTDFIIDSLVYPAEITMSTGQTGHFKSLITLYQAICISEGMPFLGYETNQTNVLYLSYENNKFVDADRIKLMMRGLNLQTLDNLHFVIREHTNDILDYGFQAQLKKFIYENEIRVIYIDTINPATPEIEDNAGKDVTRVFNQFFKPFSDTLGLHINFLHHTDKKGERYLGSIKWKANADNEVFVQRKEGTNKVVLVNEKNRWGEWDNLHCEFVFNEEFIRLELLRQEGHGRQKKSTKLEDAKDFITRLLSDKQEHAAAEIISECVDAKVCSERTVKNALRELVTTRLISNNSGSYTIYEDDRDITEVLDEA